MKLTWRKTIAGTVALLATGAFGVSANADPATPRSAAATTNSLLSGTVFGVNGKPASGATVIVTAWPNAQVEDSMPSGDPSVTLPMTVLSTTKTNSSGAYTASADMSKLTSKFTEAAGNVNLEVDTQVGDDLQTTYVAAAVPGSVAATEYDTLAVPGMRSASVNFNLATTQVTAQVQGQAATTSKVDTNRQSTSVDADATDGKSSPASSAAGYGGCLGWFSQSYWPHRLQHWLNLYSYNSTTGVALRTESLHETGIGVAVTGGSWSADGSVSHEASASTATTRVFHVNHGIYNYVNAHHWMRRCYTTHFYYQHNVHMSSFNAAIAYNPVISPRAWPFSTFGACTYYSSGHKEKTHGYNYKFGGGFAAPFITLSSLASYSTHTMTGFNPRGAYMCGNNSSGFDNAPIGGATAGEGCHSSKSGQGLVDGESDPDANKADPNADQSDADTGLEPAC